MRALLHALVAGSAAFFTIFQIFAPLLRLTKLTRDRWFLRMLSVIPLTHIPLGLWLVVIQSPELRTRWSNCGLWLWILGMLLSLWGLLRIPNLAKVNSTGSEPGAEKP
jgi:hypothetical protein